jgi:hypothetical protein
LNFVIALFAPAQRTHQITTFFKIVQGSELPVATLTAPQVVHPVIAYPKSLLTASFTCFLSTHLLIASHISMSLFIC